MEWSAPKHPLYMHFDHLEENYAMVQSNWKFDNVFQTGLTGFHNRSDRFCSDCPVNLSCPDPPGIRIIRPCVRTSGQNLAYSRYMSVNSEKT